MKKPTPCPCPLPVRLLGTQSPAVSARRPPPLPRWINSFGLSARNPTVLVRLQGPFSAADLLRHCLVGTASEDVNHSPCALASAHKHPLTPVA